MTWILVFAALNQPLEIQVAAYDTIEDCAEVRDTMQPYQAGAFFYCEQGKNQ